MRFLRNKKIFILFIIAILIGTSKLSYNYFFKVPKIRLALVEWPSFAPVVYAQILGLFEKNHLPIEIVKVKSPGQANEWLNNDKVEGVGAVLTDVVLLRSGGTPVKVVLFTDYSNYADAIIAAPGITSVTQLKNKVIGIDAVNSFSHIFTLRILEKYGLTERDVFFKVVPYDQVTEMLKKNVIQAAHTWEPELKLALDNGFHRIATAGEVPGVVIDCIAIDDEAIKDNPDVIKKFISIYYEAQKKMLENPSLATEQMKSFYGNDPKEYAESFKGLHFIDEKENREKIFSTGKGSFLESARLINDYYLKRGQINDNSIHQDIIARKLYE